MAKYDDLVKQLARIRPQDFVEWLCPQFSQIEKVTFEDREFELTYRRVDTLYKVMTKQAGEFFIHLEFQVSLSNDLPMRLHEYSARIHREVKLPVKTVVVFLDSTPAIKALEPVYRVELDGEILSELRYTKIVLPEEPWKKMVDKGFPAILPLIPFTQISPGEEKEALRKAAESIENLQDAKIRAELAAALYLLAGYTYSETIQDVIKEKLMLDLMESKTYRKMAEAEQKTGERMKAHEDLLKILNRMFGQTPAELKTQIETIRAVKKLDTLIDLALSSSSLEDFRAKMDELE